MAYVYITAFEISGERKIGRGPVGTRGEIESLYAHDKKLGLAINDTEHIEEIDLDKLHEYPERIRSSVEHWLSRRKRMVIQSPDPSRNIIVDPAKEVPELREGERLIVIDNPVRNEPSCRG